MLTRSFSRTSILPLPRPLPRCEDYTMFMTSKLRDAEAAGALLSPRFFSSFSAFSEATAAAINALSSNSSGGGGNLTGSGGGGLGGKGGGAGAGQLARAVGEMMSAYCVLEEYLMVENVNKAIRIDEPLPDSLTSSMVDDVFFILQTSTRRWGEGEGGGKGEDTCCREEGGIEAHCSTVID